MLSVRTLPSVVCSVDSASTAVAHLRIPEKSPITAQTASALSGTSPPTVASCMAFLLKLVRSDPDVILGGQLAAGLSRIQHPARLDEQDPGLVFGARTVLDALRHHEHLAGRKL